MTSEADRALAARWLGRFQEASAALPNQDAAHAPAEPAEGGGLTGLLVGLPEQVIHGDLNDYNIILTPDVGCRRRWSTNLMLKSW